MPTRKRNITFSSQGVTLTGILHTPSTPTRNTLPGIVVTGTWTSIKEQMANRYAALLAEQGFATLSFDFRGFGESEGEPRDFEHPEMKTQDIHNAVTFLAGCEEVDSENIGALGICASAGYTLANTVLDGRVKSLALVAPWLHDAEIVRSVYGGDEDIRERMNAGRRARALFEETGEVEYAPAVSETDPAAAMPFKLDFYLNPERGGIPQWPNRFAVMSWLYWLTFDPIRYGYDLAAPLRIVHSKQAATPDGVQKFYDLVKSPKELIWTGGEQTDFYDQKAQVTFAVDCVTEHFRNTLGAVHE